ncbi:hypothetical protein AHF37_03390 [Paragonimus kellicotti]|nr:hypothetical protein AHF37_03390 [Paragonimus kellicotti]
MVYKSEFAKWKEYMNYLASLSPASPMANVRQGATEHLSSPASTSLAKPHFRIDSHIATSCAATSSTLNDSSLNPASQTAPVLTDSSQRIIRLKTLPEGALLTKLFLQLNVEDLGVCLPITVAQPNPQPMGVDTRTALVLTLDRSRISACYRDSFVGQGEFTDFCLRFDDDFNVGSDDWKPDWRRASVDVQGKHHSLILNACVVPSGTFNVCSHDPDKRAQWNLLVQWQMRGLDFHLDDNIGRRLKSLISMLTRITGYDGAAPLLPTSAEEEEEAECVEGSHVQRKLSGLAETDKVPDKDESLGKQIRNANRTSISILGAQQSDVTHESSQKHGGYSDIASLDRYRPGGCPPDPVASMLPFDLSQVRSMELHKHQQELIEAQCCLAFKRQKWDTLRRKKGITMQRSPVFLHDPIKPPGATAYSNFEPQGLMIDRNPRPSIVADEPSHSRSQMVAFGRTNPSSTSVSNSDVHGRSVHRASIVSKDESVYFDMDSCEVAVQQRVSEALPKGRNNPSSCHMINDHCSNQDLWFDPQETIGFDETGFPFSDSNFLSMAEEQGEGEPTDYSSSDEAEEHNEMKCEDRSHHPPPGKTRVFFGDLSNGIQDIGTKPKVLLQVNVQIHIDSGCCVLHPRLPQEVLSTSVDLYSPTNPNIIPAQYRFLIPNTIASRPQTELGGRFSNSDLLGAYLERYKKHLLQDTQFLSTDLSVFLLPAVDIGLHYNSMTEVYFHTSSIPTGPSVPPTSVTISGTSLLLNQPTIVHSTSLSLGSLRMDAYGTPSGKQPMDTTIPESKASTSNSHDCSVGYKPAMGNSGLKKQTDLFVSFFLQKLPKELIVHPALLDFLEQALESIPLLADWEVESASISSDGEQAGNKRNNSSASHSAPLDTRFWETFPVHTVVHLHVQPMTVRFLCLPTSRMQCLMSLPFLDVIFSTNRSEVDGDAESSPIQNEACNRMPVISGENHDGSAPRQSENRLLPRPLADEYRSFKNPVCYVNKIVDPVDDSKSKRHLQSPWLAAGSLSLGPVHVNVAKVAERPEIPLWRLAFLKRHDSATKRLWFLWSNEAMVNHACFRRAPKTTFMNSTYIAPNITQNCGCFGQCSFFGPNAYGHMLFDELSSGNFQQRAVFPPRSDYKPHSFSSNNTHCVNNPCAPFGFGLFSSAYSNSKDNTPDVAPSAAHFGESLLVEHRLLHELHNPSFCQERHNGLSLMREETIVAYALSTGSNEGPRTCERCCDDCYLSDRADDSTSSSNTEPSLPGSPMDDAQPGYYGDASSSCDHYNPKRQAVLIKSASRPSSMSELLVPPDSQDEDDASSVLAHSQKALIHQMSHSVEIFSIPSSRSSLSSDNLHVTGVSEVHITSVISAKPATPPRRHIPPTPPPRQFTKKTADNVVAQKTVQARPFGGATSSDVVIETNLEKASEKFVDLRGQLNRPITDSGLLRSAYSHHLSVYRCASDWAPIVKLNRRWHLCKSVYSSSELQPTRYNASDTSADQANRVRFTWPYCRMGPALAPRFELVQPGLSPRHIVSKTDAQTTGCSTEKSTCASFSDSVDHGTSKRIAARSDVIVWLQNSVDLLLSPLFAESLERYLTVLTPVMINTSPSSVVNQLHIHCVNSQSRKIGHSIQTRSSDIHTYPTSTSDENPFVSSDRLDTSTDLLHQHVFSGSHLLPPPPLELPAKQSGQKVSAPQVVSVSVAPEASVTLADYACSPGEPVKLLADPIVPAASEVTHVSHNNSECPQVLRVSKRTSFDRRLSVPCRGLCESRTRRVIGSGKLTALSVERINVCFLQLYAVEDLVHLDSLRSGLHDLTCVSLLTFCVESVSFEMMSYNETYATLPNLEVPSLTPVESEAPSDGSDPSRQPLLKQFPEELSNDFGDLKRPDDRTWDTQFVSQNTPALAESKLSRLVSYPSMSETDNPASIPALSSIALPTYRLNHSRQPSAPPALTNSSVPEERLALAVSLSDCLHHDSALPCIADQKLTLHNSSISEAAVINSKEETHCPLSIQAPPNHCHDQPTTDVTFQGEVFDDQVMIDLANVLACHGVPGSESVFQLNISRIHGQLRRLTRFSQFSANVLLTAIPFESSRTFFAFEFDKDLQTNLTQPASASRSVPSWNEQSAGWIMFECGLEKLSLSCDCRDGFGDTVSDGKLAVNCVKSSHTDHGGTSEEEHMNIHESTSAKLRANKQPSFRKKKISMSTAFTVLESAARSSSYSGQPESKHRTHTVLRNVVGPGKKQANSFRNGVLSQLRVSTVWLNFPTPKRLPNKRRVELVRSDWNLLSTAAPSIKAWMDPSGRLIQISRRLYAGIERRYLAAISCLMTEAVNYKLPGDGGLFLLHCLGTKDLDGYDRHRTSTARALRFDPSCQLFVVLRRYLFALIEQYGLLETDRMFSDWLKDSIVPPNDLLQCGILSLTREWRLLVELLAIISQDLRAKTNGRTSPLLPLSVAPVLGINNCPTVSLDHGGDSIIRDLKASRTFEGKTVTSPLLPAVNFAPNPNVLGTSHLLRMASNPVSPIISRVLPAPVSYKDPACQACESKDPPTTQFMDDHSVCTVAFPDNDPLQKKNENTLHKLGLVDTCPTSIDEHSDNVMLRRFLQDSKVPVVESLQSRDIPQKHFATFASRNLADADRSRMDLDSSEFAALRRASDPMWKLSPADRHSQSTEADVMKPDRPLFPHSDESEAAERRTNSKLGDRLGVKLPTGTEPMSSEVNVDAVQSPDVRFTTTEFEQAAHLKAQCQHVAYIQRFFSPLLESVGLSAKGIRRTTLMKKFGGYFSADGLLQKFQIEIVSSVRNPGVLRSTTTTTASGFGHAHHLTAPYSGTNSRSTASTSVGIRHCAFLCRNFSSKFTFRDIVDRGGNHSRVGVIPSAQVDIMPTTTNIDVLLNIDFLRQHINLPLLRLLHQFVTMVYCARDAHNSTELRHMVMDTAASDVGLSRKHGSRESSDLTDGTLYSRSSGYVRFGGGSVESCADRRNPLAHMDILSSADIPLTAETQCDLRSLERVSRSSAEKYSQKVDPLRLPIGQRQPTTSVTKLSYPLTASHLLCKTGDTVVSTADTFTPACWRRLLNYVELYTTVPKTRMVLRKPPNSSSSGTTMPTITEEDRDFPSGPAGGGNRPRFKMNTVDNPPTTLDPGVFPGIAIVKPTILGRRLLTTVSYQPLNEDIESGPINLQGTQGESVSDTPGDTLHPIGTCVTIPVDHTHNARPSRNLLSSHEVGILRKVDSVLPTPRSGAEPCFSPMVFDQFTRPWLCSERVPLAIFVTTKVQQMTMSAVLSEINLVAGVRNAHGSFTHSTQLHIRGKDLCSLFCVL